MLIKNAPRFVSAGAFLFMMLAVPAGCGPGGGPEGDMSDSPAARGARVYRVNCIACHHPDPALDGSVGPAIKGSPRALVEARVMRAEYPPGYTPKRTSKLMPPQPHLAAHVDDLTAFLNQSD